MNEQPFMMNTSKKDNSKTKGKIRKAFNNAVNIVYKICSSYRPYRIRTQQKNQTASEDTEQCTLVDLNSATVIKIDNNIKNNIDLKNAVMWEPINVKNEFYVCQIISRPNSLLRCHPGEQQWNL